MRKIFSLVLILLTFVGSSQESENYFFVRNFNNSLIIQANNVAHEKFIYNEYGTTQIINQKLSYTSRYLFQSQENDFNFALIYFPSRYFNTSTFRFQSPDPKSQYYSPYLFVNADPVNTIDLNGEEGKPLILYEEDYRFKDGIPNSVSDLFKMYPDAHYYPLRKLTDRQIRSLPDWNGNVFIDANAHDGNIVIEKAAEEETLRSKSDMVKRMSADAEMRTIPPEHLGLMIQDFSLDRKVPLKSIMLGKNAGGKLIERMGKGLIWANKGEEAKNTVRIAGLNEGLEGRIVGPFESKRLDLSRLFRDTNYYIHSARQNPFPEPTTNPPGTIRTLLRRVSTRSLIHTAPSILEEHEIIDLINGRIPLQHIKSFNVLIGGY